MLELFAVVALVFATVCVVIGFIFDYLPQPIREISRGISNSLQGK